MGKELDDILRDFFGKMNELQQALITHYTRAILAHRKEFVANLAWFQFMEKTYHGMPQEMRDIASAIYEQEKEAVIEIEEAKDNITKDYEELSILWSEFFQKYRDGDISK